MLCRNINTLCHNINTYKNIQSGFHLGVFHRVRFAAPSKDQPSHPKNILCTLLNSKNIPNLIHVSLKANNFL